MCFNVLSKLRLFPILLPGGNTFFPDSTANAPSISTHPASFAAHTSPYLSSTSPAANRSTTCAQDRAEQEKLGIDGARPGRLASKDALLYEKQTPSISRAFPQGSLTQISPCILIFEVGKANGFLFLKMRKQTQRSELGGLRS